MLSKITSRHFEVREELEDFINAGLEHLNSITKIDKADVILDYHKHEKENKIVEIILHSLKSEFFAKESAEEFETAVSECLDKLKKQVIKHKEKIQAHH